MSESRTSRPFKGNSIIEFPDNYIIIDIETTGLSPAYDSIIEVSAIKYIEDNETDRFSSLLRPDAPIYDNTYIDAFITALTGITNDMIIEAPTSSDVLRAFRNFIGDFIIIGHNIGFDINFLYDNFEKYFDCHLVNDHVNTARIFRKLHPEVGHHRLEDMANQYHVDYSGAHRAFKDCMITKSCLDEMKSEILKKYPDYNTFKKTFKSHHSSGCTSHSTIHTDHYQNTRIDSVPAFEGDVNPENPLFKKVCVFTGALETMTRAAATQMVLNCGGECGSSVTRKTNYLILGNTDYCSNIKDGKSSKHKKAEELKLAGQDIEIITESVFLDLLRE